MVAGVVASMSTMIVVSLATQKMSPVPPNIIAAMDDADNVGPIPAKYFAAADPELAVEAAAIEKGLDGDPSRD
jgi:hypothetical protein